MPQIQTEIFWIASIILFSLVEAFTAGMVSVWFAVGSLAALIVTIVGGNIYFQIASFIVISVVCFIFLRKVALKTISKSKSQTDLGRIIGKSVLITQTVDNIKNTGLAQINDVEWKVKSSTGDIINEGELAVVEKIEGVKLIVKG